MLNFLCVLFAKLKKQPVFVAEPQQPRMQIFIFHLLMLFWQQAVLAFFSDTWIILSETSRQLGSSVLFNNMALFFSDSCFPLNGVWEKKPQEQRNQCRLHYLFCFVPDSWHLWVFFFILVWGHNMLMLSVFNW